MKTFKDLTFETHPCGEGQKAILWFDNGRAVSVITGADWFLTSVEAPYEVAFIKEDGSLGRLIYDGSSDSVDAIEDADHNNVAAHCTEHNVNLIMKAIQKL